MGMHPVKVFINRHKWLVTIFSIVFIGLPQYVDSVLGLAEKISGRQLALPDITWGYWITVPLGIVMFTIAIWAIKSNKSSGKQSEDTPKKVRYLFRDMIYGVHAHNCSKCGWGIQVDVFDRVATCPKCGNVDKI